ncbi:MAG: oligosaccharide flippase family protein [Pseudomonadota bacterium]
MLKKAVLLVSGNAFGSALLLVRNLIVARLLSPDDYGIAATFAISMSIVEMMSYLGLQQLIVVDRDGNDPHVQKAMQGFQVVRGVFSAAAMFAIAHPYARFLGIDEVAWAYQVIALVPLVNGFQHFDQHRMKRQMNFRPSIIIGLVPALVAVVTLWPLAVLFQDYRIMLASLFVQYGSQVLLTHLMAERPYRIGWDMAIVRRSVRFGWPLLLNGIMLFGIFNGEKLIVGRELGMAELAIFSMGFTLTLTPTLVLANSIQSFFLPQLTAARDRTDHFQRLSVATVEASLAVCVLSVLGVSLFGGPVAYLLLGPKYVGILAILVPLAVLQGARAAKTGSSVVALARQRSGNSIVANIFRVASLPISWLIAIRTGDLLAIIWVATAAEVMGFLMALYLVRGRAGMRLRSVALPVALTAASAAAAAGVSLAYPSQVRLADQLHLPHLGVLILSLAALASMTELRGFLARRFLTGMRG